MGHVTKTTIPVGDLRCEVVYDPSKLAQMFYIVKRLIGKENR